MMRSANPALNANVFQNIARTGGSEVMTIGGTVNRSMILLMLAMVSAAWVWSLFFAGTNVSAFAFGGSIIGLVFAIATVFKKEWSGITAPLYALAEGTALGAISAMFEASFPGLVIQAVGLTFCTMFALLFAYQSGFIKVTDNFRLGLFAATGGICLVYVLNMVLGFFGLQVPFLHDTGPIGIGISLVIVVIAALNLVLDFDFIERGAQMNLPKYMEWYGAFGLMVTLVWLYLEILRLLSKFAARRD